MKHGFWFLAVISMGLLSGCDLSPRWQIDAPQFYPAAIEYLPDTNEFLVGSYHDGATLAYGRDGSARPAGFDNGTDPRPSRILRIRVDAARQRIWFLDAGAAYVYALPERKLIRRIQLPRALASVEECLPDLMVDATGMAFVSDNQRPTLYRIHDRTFKVDALPVKVSAESPQHSGFSALLALDSPYSAIAGSAGSGQLWLIDLTTGRAELIPLSRPIRGICALALGEPEDRLHSYLVKQGPILFGATGFQNGIVRIELTPDLHRGIARTVAPYAKVDTPVGIVSYRDRLLLAGSQLHHHGDFGGMYQPFLPFRIAVVLKRLETIIDK